MVDLDCLDAMLDQGQEKELIQQWLHPQEQSQFQQLRHNKRRVEWLGGRICAKKALLQFLIENSTAPHILVMPQLQIMTTDSGRPFPAPESLPEQISPPNISISHSRGYAMGVAATIPCGVDIQITKDALLRIKDRFCSQDEAQLLKQTLVKTTPLEQLTLLWAAKEAIKKNAAFTGGMPGFLELELTGILGDGDGDELTGYCFNIAYHRGKQIDSNFPAAIEVSVCLHGQYGFGLCLIPRPFKTGRK
jgi:phosphopantetheinyl transferase